MDLAETKPLSEEIHVQRECVCVYKYINVVFLLPSPCQLAYESSRGTTRAMGPAWSSCLGPDTGTPSSPRNGIGMQSGKLSWGLGWILSVVLVQGHLLKYCPWTPAGRGSSRRQPGRRNPCLGKAKEPPTAEVPGLCSLPGYFHLKAKVNNKRITTGTFSLGLLSF